MRVPVRVCMLYNMSVNEIVAVKHARSGIYVRAKPGLILRSQRVLPPNLRSAYLGAIFDYGGGKTSQIC